MMGGVCHGYTVVEGVLVSILPLQYARMKKFVSIAAID